MVFAEYGGNRFYVFSHGFEFIDDEMAGIFLVGIFNLFFGQAAQAGNLSVDIIGMGGSIAGNAPSRLCPAGGIGRVGMYNPSYFRKCLVQLHMGRRIGRGVIFSFHFIPVQIHNHHILRGEAVIVHTAGFDGKKAAFPVDFTHISPGKSNQAVPGKKHIGLIYSFFQFF